MKRLAIIFAILLLSSAAQAEYIETPAYPAGQAQINESGSFIHSKDDAYANSLEFSYGFNNWLAGVVALNSAGGENLNYNYYSGADITAQIDLLKETDNLPGTAIRFTYSLLEGSQNADTASVMGVFEKKYGLFDNFLNIAVGKTIGDNAIGGAEFGVAAQSMYGLNDYTNNDEWAFGAEYFGDYGKTGSLQGFAQKGQQLGPIIGFQPFGNLDTSLNYLFGLTHDAPRSTVTFEINLTF